MTLLNLLVFLFIVRQTKSKFNESPMHKRTLLVLVWVSLQLLVKSKVIRNYVDRCSQLGGVHRSLKNGYKFDAGLCGHGPLFIR